jgi:hypothetical protein
MQHEHASKGLLPAYVGYHSTDGASNAVASANHYELLTEMNRDAPIHHDKCMAHQNNRSAKYASGTGDFKHCRNSVLRDVLVKTHNIIGRVHRSIHRIKIVRDVQKAAHRSVVVLPSPSVVTRWDSSNIEVASVNRIMGDLNKALGLLLDGDDKRLLVNKDGVVLPRSEFMFTKTDKTILRQFECGSEPCLLLSKFFQLNESTCHETLFVTRARIAQMRETTFEMYGDISHSVVPDLRSRNKTKLVVETLSDATDDVNEKLMEPCIKLFRELYSDDMEERCGLSEGVGDPVTKVPTIIGFACLLNPLYGGKMLVLFHLRLLIVTVSNR